MSRKRESVFLKDLTVNTLTSEGKKVREVYDTQVRGFYLLITLRGHKSWGFRYTAPRDKKERRLRIGSYPAVSLKDARAQANEWRTAVEKGRDPRADKDAEEQAKAHAKAVKAEAEAKAAAAPQPLRPIRHGVRLKTAKAGVVHKLGTWSTFRAVYETWLALEVETREGTDEEMRSKTATMNLIEGNILKDFAEMKVADFRRADYRQIIDPLRVRTPSVAKKVHTYLNQLLAFALSRDVIEANPIGGLKLKIANKARTRVLTGEELAIVWHLLPTAFDGIEVMQHAANLLRLQILTGQRVNEIAGLHESEINTAEKLALIPASRMKPKVKHEVPFSDAAMAIIDEQRKHAKGGYLFPALTKDAPIRTTTISHHLRQVQLKLNTFGIDVFGTHDLRRSYVTNGVALGSNEEHIERAISHLQKGIKKNYNHHAYRAEKRVVMEAYAAFIERVTNPPGGTNVVPLRTAA